jgi:hypothetical protein
MSRFRLSFLLTLGLLLGAHPVLAATYAVGTCKPSVPSYPTISAAVASPLTVGSTILVCPGTYPEQVIIAQPLTLEGISSGNSAQAVITVPGGGLSTTSSVLLGTLAAQLEVISGPVNIINITVDGAGGSNGCSSNLVGIYYDSSSGTVNEVTVRNEMNAGCGFGILAENGTATNESVTIENSSVHDVDFIGIISDSNQSPGTLIATIKGNYIQGGIDGIYENFGAAGSVTGNNVTAATGHGIVSTAPVIISDNTVASPLVGIGVQAPGVSVTSNKISNSSLFGIELLAAGMTIKSNTIAKSNIGIEFFCNTGNTVSGNTVNDAATGLKDVPLVSTPTGFFFNVATLRTDGCGFAGSRAPSLPSPFNHHPN